VDGFEPAIHRWQARMHRQGHKPRLVVFIAMTLVNIETIYDIGNIETICGIGKYADNFRYGCLNLKYLKSLLFLIYE